MLANREKDSYAGIVAALNAVALYNGKSIEAYEPNFHGIIEAILNLGQLGDASLGEYPPFWEIETDGDGNIIGGDFTRPPVNGDLWFDTRQGRLMVYVDDAYYQTNGADVLTTVSNNQPEAEVVGALWYNPSTGSLFVYDGTVWNNVTSTIYSTTNLPLTTPLINESADINTILKIADAYTPGSDYTQSTLNQWVVSSIGKLDKQIEENYVQSNVRETYYQSSAPATAIAGNVWFDSGTKSLKVYTNGSWLQATDLTSVNNEIDDIKNCHNLCEQANAAQFNALNVRVDTLPFASYATNDSVTNQINAINLSIANLDNEIGDLNRFELKSNATIEHNALDQRLVALETKPETDLSGYSTTAQTNHELDLLEQKIVGYNYATQAYVSDKIAEIDIPNVANKLDSSVHTDYVEQADNTFVKKVGGKITGGLTLDYPAIDNPTLDFSSSFAAGIKALAIQAKDASTPAYFGTSITPNELLWEFQGNENFVWKHKSKNVFSVNKAGASTTSLTVNGIDVEAKLTQLQSQISSGNTGGGSAHDHSEIQEAINALQTQVSEGLCTNQIHYQDAAPTNVHDGDIWFNSQTLTLYVRHSNAWINPDRVTDETVVETTDLDEVTNDITELQSQLQILNTSVASLNGNDLNLKADLFNAVRGSTSFADLKSRLMSALSS